MTPAGIASVDRIGRIAVVRVTGELDIATAPELAAAAPQAEAADARVMELTGVTFVDSAGVRAIEQLARAWSEQDVPVRIVAPAGGAARFALDLCGFPGHLLCGRLEDALGEVRDDAAG